MDVQFEKTSVSFLEPVLWDVQNMEQTQEIRIPEGMPGIGRVICTWGQPVLRSKEWQGGRISVGTGMMVWVLYAPEDGGTPQQVESWIPFQFHWDLPDTAGEGRFLVTCLPRFADTRSVSAGKMLIRCGISALVEAYAPMQREVYTPGNMPEGLELLTNTYPMRLPKEAGEKQFELEETLRFPGSVPVPSRLIRWRLDASAGDRKLLGGRLVFRGSGDLHILYESGDGQMHTWSFELPFSQFAELETAHSQEAQADIRLMPTNLELTLDEEGNLHFRGALTAQYLVDDRENLTLAEDAWSPERNLELRREMLHLPALLDSRRELVSGEMKMPAEADLVADIQLMPEFPQVTGEGMTRELSLPGIAQALYYDTDGQLRGMTQRWEGKHSFAADDSAWLRAVPASGSQVQAQPGAEGIEVRGTVPVQIGVSGGTGLPMVTAMEAGEPIVPDPNRPALVLCRAGRERLWELARRNGSTVAAIRAANDLEGDPEPGRMLLIPVK